MAKGKWYLEYDDCNEWPSSGPMYRIRKIELRAANGREALREAMPRWKKAKERTHRVDGLTYPRSPRLVYVRPLVQH